MNGVLQLGSCCQPCTLLGMMYANTHISSTAGSLGAAAGLAGAGPFYVAQYVPYTPASYIAHQAPPGAYAYSGIHGPGPAAVYGMMPPSNGHASPHMIPVGPYQQPMAPYMAAPAVHGPPAGNTWSPRTGSWSVQGSYAPKVVFSWLLNILIVWIMCAR